jgi:hypothetical protein
MWVYEIITGNLYRGGVELIGKGYSGHPPYVNKPEAQALEDRGPIPEGIWHIGEPFDSPNHGPFCLPLTPIDPKATFGRSGFLMHGDKKDAVGKQASKGCIIQARDVREAVHSSPDKFLKVISGLISNKEQTQ